MATTCMDVFSAAMGLIDSVNESTGATDTSDNLEYKQRVLLILNVLQGELYPYSDTYAAQTGGKRSIPPALTALTDEIALDDFICRTVMPYGLAAHLVSTEDAALASFMEQRYEELRDKYATVPAESSEITNLYGGIEYGEFGEW